MRVYLQTVPDDNQAQRFCHLQLQPDMLEGWQLVRESGQQGARGSVTRSHYASEEEAVAELERQRERLQRRGYRVMFAEGVAGHHMSR
jgi:predicted DNA-binding WGR domain protein